MKRIVLILELISLLSSISILTIYKLKAESQVSGIVWSKQFGTNKEDSIDKIVTDDQGNIYVVGKTEGNLFRTNSGGEDFFIAKFSPNGDLI